MGDTTYVQLFHSILDSSIWFEPPDTFKVWVTLLLMSNRHGYVGASLAAIARRANLPIGVAREALVKFESPDQDSRSENDEGRRIKRVERGWEIINYKKLRETAAAERARESKRLSAERRRSRSRCLVESTVDHREGDQELDQESDPEVTPIAPPLGEPPPRAAQGKAPRARRIPEDWTPTDAHRQMATDWQLNCALMADTMRDWAKAKGASKIDWDATFRGFLRSEAIKRNTWVERNPEARAQKLAKNERSIQATRANLAKELP